jgi:AsmA protein
VIRALKWVGIGIGGILALGLLAALALPSLVNLDRYRTLLAGRMAKTLGRDVRLESLQVHLWHGLGAEARGIQIADQAGFGPDPFLAAESLRVQVQLLPLLKGQVRVTNAVIERPRVRLTHTKDGHWSFEDLVKAPPAAPPVRPHPEISRVPKAPLFGGLLLNEIAIRQGEITLFEQGGTAPATISLGNLDVTLRQPAQTDPIAVRSSGTLRGDAVGRVELTGTITPGDADGPRLDAVVTLAEGDWKGWPTVLPAAAAIAGPVSAEMRVSGPLSRLGFAGSLDLKGAKLGVGTAFQKPAGEAARLSFEGQREEPGLRLSKVRLDFRDMTVDGSLRVPDLKTPRLLFALGSPKLDLDRLLASPAAGAKPGASHRSPGSGVAWAASPPPGKGSAASSPGATPLSAQGQVRIEELLYKGLSWRKVEADVTYRNSLLTLPRIVSDVLGGKIQAAAEADFRARAPRVSLTSRAAGVATEPIVRALGLGNWVLKSVLDFEARLSFAGLSASDILGSANGEGSFLFQEGQVIGYRPLERLAEVVTPILAAGGTKARLNEFKEVRGTYTVSNGIVRTRDFTLTKTEGTVAAAGALGLLDGSLDFDVAVRLGRTAVESRVTGTTAQPIVVVKLDRLQRKLETELNKIQPEGQGKGLKDFFRGLFKK